MIKILKASAGSGKTYKLTETYIRILLKSRDPYSYRHTLAVTFTNKATDEMKRRILKELHVLSVSPEKSAYLDTFVPQVCDSQWRLKEKAGIILKNILHDYGSFAVSTIDRFFQQTLKAFSREIGQFSSYQVALDVNSLVTETVDRILDSLTESEPTLLNWLSNSMMDQVEQGKRFNLSDGLVKIANQLKSDEHRSVLERYGTTDEVAYSKENLQTIKNLLNEQVKAFPAAMIECSKKVQAAFDMVGVRPEETSYHFMAGALNDVCDPTRPLYKTGFGKRFLDACDDYTAFFSKKDAKRYAPYESVLLPAAVELRDTFLSGLKVYNTSKLLLGQINDLGIAAELSREFTNLMKEKNVLSLDDSNVILKNIIDGSDAPFVYEKLGVRFENFLLDEFQDTSRIQWDNFQPLIENSDSQNYENLLVGDVKQSIYRFRGSDWRLMSEDVQKVFPKAEIENLGSNWRSLKNIVEFNNAFFPFAAKMLDCTFEGSEPSSEITMRVSPIYNSAELAQTVQAKGKDEGIVEVIVVPKDTTDDDVNPENVQILATINRLLNGGANLSDIAILVRGNKTGADVADFLVKNGVEVVSDDSLYLKASYTVRKIVSLISCVANPDNLIGSYLATSSNFVVEGLSYRSLTDLCEQLIRAIAKKDGNTLLHNESQYVQSFMDYVQDYVKSNGNEPAAFLKAWKDADPKLSSTTSANAVKIITIHKSKGLEYPYVIFPYAEDVELYNHKDSHWVVADVDDTPLEPIAKIPFNISLSGTSSSTCFAREYNREQMLQFVDNINIFYVALTRASKGMTIICKEPKDKMTTMTSVLTMFLGDSGNCHFKRTTAVDRMKDEEKALKKSETKDVVAGDSVETPDREAPKDEKPVDIFTMGVLPHFEHKEEDTNETRIDIDYPSFPLNEESSDENVDVRQRGRLKFTADSIDFFSQDVQARHEAQLNGMALHEILSRVVKISDLEASVSKSVEDGNIDESQAESTMELFKNCISSHPSWFPEQGAEVLNEIDLVDIDGNVYRPDRVVIEGDKVEIIDYKFGAKDPRYGKQVSRYAAIFRNMGYKNVSSAIWYVPTDEVELF